jgi:hypothetical protein
MSKFSADVHVLTANRLQDGAVVFLNFDGDWAATLAGAVIARSPDEARGLEARGVHDATRNLVVDPYLVEMREVGGALLPLRHRERVRLSGPSIVGDVPGYVPPTAVARQAEAGQQAGDRAAGVSDADRGEAVCPRPEPAAGRGAHANNANNAQAA